METNEINNAILKDLDIQWNDHFHMRDQTWKTLSNSVLIFLGVVGLEIKETAEIVMIPSYIALIFIAVIGWTTATHHRVRQKQKFAIIQKYEERLGLYDLKKEIIQISDKESGISGKIFTARFIEIAQVGIIIIAFFLLINRLFIS